MTCAILVLAAALSAGNVEFDRTAAEGAARISLDRASAELVRTGLPEGGLAQAMLADPARYTRRKEAEKACRDLYEQALGHRFDSEAEAIRTRLGLPEDFELQVRPADREALQNRFAKVFADERARAVAEQAKGIVTTMRPTEGELETKKEDVLRREMTARILSEQQLPVFEENVNYISKGLVGEILASGFKERTRQEDYLKRARSDAAVPSAMTRELDEKLAAHVAEQRKGADPCKAWGVFPSVRERLLPAVVKRRLTGRFAGQVEGVQSGLPVAEVEAAIARDPSRHLKSADSERAFSELIGARILETAIERSVADLSLPDRGELREFLTGERTSEAAVKAVERVIRRDVIPSVRTARAELARRFAETAWPTLTDESWYPDAQLADDFAARSDFDEAVKAWRTAEALRAFAEAARGGAVLEEADRLADRQMSKALTRARSAVTAQSAIVDEVHPAVLAEAKKAPADLAAVVGQLTEATLAAWQERRGQVLWGEGPRPENADEQHAVLFPSVIRKIELIARQILEEVQQAQEKKPKEEKTPEEPTPDDSSSGDSEDTPLFSLAVRRVPSGLELKLLQGSKTVKESVVPAKATDFRSAMDELTRVISSDVLNLK